MPISPTLNVVVPSGGTKTAMQEPLISTKKNQEQRKRPKTAQYRGGAAAPKAGNLLQKRRVQTGTKRLKYTDSVATSSLIVMNDKKMSVAAGTTTQGILALYNKGFVPKKSGLVSRASRFNRQLYSTATGGGIAGERHRNVPTTAGWISTGGSIDDKESFTRVNSCTDTGKFPSAYSG